MNDRHPTKPQSSACWAVFMALAVIPSPVGEGEALAQTHAQSSSDVTNNLVHAPKTKTAPLGQLGHVERRGTGPVPMILIPGAAFDWTIWEDFMARNVDRYTMYAVTPPGYGGTAPPPMPPGVDYGERPWTNALCSAIVELIQREKLERPIVVGHHMHGDHYALRVGLDHPDKVRGVVVIAGAPSKAFPGPGNAKGKPPVFASPAQRNEMVHGYWLSSYRNVTPASWRAASFQARLFCRDKLRAKELFEQQVSVPIPTQVRYALEYMTTDSANKLDNLSVPLLVVQPRIEWTLETVMDAMREMNEMLFANQQEAADGWEQLLSTFWGDAEKGVQQIFDGGHQWEQLRERVPNFRIQYIGDTGIFVMEDQPERLDAIMQSFAKRVGSD